ncbi:MAG: 50S ribosomal protein L6 [Bacteroidetes bacterium HGW-Bacteroidetes-1]|jgi:large subunit ribosomal protein L6|nr:MAG: 50S ribosomal protein L6 [Bacteroidetes bacterium HGW-Bacteroidetes-1]
MSRIGKLPISLPAGVTVNVSDDGTVTVKGKLGELKQKIDESVSLKIEDDQVVVDRKSDEIEHRAKHGLYRSLINNMVKGVSEGFSTVQELVGVGYKADAKGQILELALGYSHNIFFEIPQEIKIETVTERGKNPIIKMSCADKQLLGQVAAKIRSLRKPEPYKGKGIKFQNEVLRRKAGKTAGKGK